MAIDLDYQKWVPVAVKNSEYVIEELVRTSERHPFDSPITVAMYVVSWSLWVSYFTLRYQSLPSSERMTGAPNWLPVLTLLAEFSLLLPAMLNALHMSLYLFFGTRGKHRPSYRLVGEAAPSIDVCITCCGEKLDVIMDTAAGAAMQDYPAERFRVFVLDDGKSGTLEKAIDAYNKKYGKNVHYLARTKLPNESHFYKAGNLRFGLTTTESRGKGSVFFASLDVDMIPEADWLRRVVPHLILDEKLALASPAQWHYNLPHPDLLGQAGPAAMEIFEPMHDNIGCSHCFGSGYIVRRSALNDIGGWPKVPVGEDIFCSYMLAGHGWGIAFVKEFVQYGLTADSFAALAKQRMRWTDGDLLLLKGINFFVPALDPAPRRTVPQRMSAIIKILRLFTAVTDCAGMVLLPAIIWMTSRSPEKAAVGANAAMLKAVFLATILADKLNYALIYAKVGRQTESRFWAAPYSTARILNSILPSTIISFTATGTVISAANERSARHRQGLVSRLLTPTMLAYFTYTVLATVAFLSVLYDSLWPRGQQRQRLHSPMCTGVVLRLLECIFKVSVPLRYMAFPPTVPERRELMQQDSLGVFRPKCKYNKIVSRRFTWLDILEVGTILMMDWSALETML